MTYIIDNFPNHVSGDTFSGRAWAITVNGVAPSLAGALIRLRVGDKYFSTDTGELEITDVGKFQLKPDQIIALHKKLYDIEITIKFSTGKTKTWIKGTWLITE
jgi:hypothetical protein